MLVIDIEVIKLSLLSELLQYGTEQIRGCLLKSSSHLITVNLQNTTVCLSSQKTANDCHSVQLVHAYK